MSKCLLFYFIFLHFVWCFFATVFLFCFRFFRCRVPSSRTVAVIEIAPCLFVGFVDYFIPCPRLSYAHLLVPLYLICQCGIKGGLSLVVGINAIISFIM